MTEVVRVRRSTAIAALCALAMSAVLAACGDDDSGGGKQADAGSKPHGSDAGDSGVMPSECDDDDGGPGTGCDDGYACMHGGCVVNECGDGVKLRGKEECDDGNVAAGDGCDPGCHIEKPGCGDGKVGKHEECDDGNRYDTDACSNACVLNECGNERIDVGEECDDGNKADDDECSNGCTENRCRNGRVDPGEECDDGNRINDDGCSNACKVVLCGDGKQQGKEECDDGNQVDDDSCSNKCTANVCKNGRVDPGELCDGFGCADDCKSMVTDMCRPCEDEMCTTYSIDMLDLVAGCLEGMPLSVVVPDPDPMFMQDCIDAVTCAHQNNCGFGDLGPITCYCGSDDIDTCADTGPVTGAPCADAWRHATRGTTNSDVFTELGDLSLPSGWAYLLLQCDAANCAEVCGASPK